MKKLFCTAAALAALVLSVPADAASFDGPYVGLQAGHNNTKSDVQWNNIDGSGIDLGSDNGASGLELGAVAGYRKKQDRFAYGLEASADLSNAEGTLLSYDDGVDTFGLKVEKLHSYAIGPRVGYLITDSVLASAGIDWTRGKFEMTATMNGSSATGSENLNGVRFGVGLEAAATEKINVRLDYQHTNWKTSSDSDGSGGTFSLDPTEDTARIGAIYSF